MAAIELALILLATVLASAVIDQLLPRLPLPLIQIACGVIVALLARQRIAITIDPDIFLVLFIAPLLFNEARQADKAQLWHNRHSMLSFAIGLVVAIVLAVGFIVNAFIPSIPLAAAFALGAALGPTDPIAVASVSKRAEISERQKTVLQGESLLNDASGIVSFQFAVAAVVTGTFSAMQAVGSFAISFFGALAVGVLLGYVFVKIADKVRGLGIENTTFHVTLELVAPFIAYLLGETIHVSGVILVVACGITMSLVPRSLGPAFSRMNIVSTSVWNVISFAFNGAVFVILGTQLPQAFGDMWIEDGIDNFHLTLYILVITVAVHGMRFIWTFLSEARVFHGQGKSVSIGKRIRSAAVMTFSGSKGAITLAIMLTLPRHVYEGTALVDFPQRDLLIFLACGVILLSLIFATFLVPILAPRTDDPTKARERDDEARAEILRQVIEELTARQTPKNRRAYSSVIAQYTKRLERYKEKRDLEDESDLELRLMALEWEQDYVYELVNNDEVPPLEGYQYISRVANISSLIRREKFGRVALARRWRRLKLLIRKTLRRIGKKLPGDIGQSSNSSSSIMRDIQARADTHVIKMLKEMMPESDIQSEKISQLIREYEHSVTLLRGTSPSITAMARQNENDLDALRFALRIELEKIQQAYEDGQISREAAQNMRRNVYLIQLDVEDYL